MIVKVACFWEQGWDVPTLEWDKWEMPLRDFAVDEFIMSPITGIERVVKEYTTIEDILTANPTLTPIYVDEKAETDLEDFVHPRDALYIFGKTSYAPYDEAFNKDPNIKSIKITTISNLGLLWGHQAAVLVLYDRMKKSV